MTARRPKPLRLASTRTGTYRVTVGFEGADTCPNGRDVACAPPHELGSEGLVLLGWNVLLQSVPADLRRRVLLPENAPVTARRASPKNPKVDEISPVVSRRVVLPGNHKAIDDDRILRIPLDEIAESGAARIVFEHDPPVFARHRSVVPAKDIANVVLSRRSVVERRMSDHVDVRAEPNVHVRRRSLTGKSKNGEKCQLNHICSLPPAAR